MCPYMAAKWRGVLFSSFLKSKRSTLILWECFSSTRCSSVIRLCRATASGRSLSLTTMASDVIGSWCCWCSTRQEMMNCSGEYNIRTYVCTYNYTYVLYVCTHTYSMICIHICIVWYVQYTYMYIYARTHAHLHTYIHTQTYVYTHMHSYTHVRIHTYWGKKGYSYKGGHKQTLQALLCSPV